MQLFTLIEVKIELNKNIAPKLKRCTFFIGILRGFYLVELRKLQKLTTKNMNANTSTFWIILLNIQIKNQKFTLRWFE